MSVRRFSRATVRQGILNYKDFLAGNPEYGPPGFESIATVTTTGGETSFLFSSIPQTYTSLQFRGFVARNTTTEIVVQFRLNDDDITLSSRHSIYGNGATVTVLGQGSWSNVVDPVAYVIGTTTGGAFIVDIHDYASTTRYKTVRSFGGYDNNGSGRVNLTSSLYPVTSAITSVRVLLGGATFQAGSTVALYGIKAGA